MLRRLFLFLCCLVAALSVGAQDVTPETNTSIIFNGSAEVIFPQAVRFEVNSALGADDLATATLVVQPDGAQPISIDVNIGDASVLKAPYARLDYIWQLPRENPPHLFKDISYTWRLTSKANETAEFTDKILFTDTRVQWAAYVDEAKQISLTLPMVEIDRKIQEVSPVAPQVQPTLQATLAKPNAAMTSAAATAPPRPGSTPRASQGNVEPNTFFTPSAPTPSSRVVIDERSVTRLRQQLQPIYDLLAANTGGKPSFNFLVYTGSLTPTCQQNAKKESVAVAPQSGTSIPCDPVLAAIVMQASGFDVIQSLSSAFGSITPALTDYMARRFYAPLWANKNVPLWFVAGIGQFYTPTAKTFLLPNLVTAARNGKLLSLEVMAAPPGAEPNLWQAQSYGMTLYLADQIGVPGLIKFARDIGSAKSFEDAYQAAMGKSSASLLADFGKWLFSDRAAGAFGVSAYQEATATPTATATATATITPTATATPTITPTPTVTGTLSPTPPIKRIATQTATPQASPSFTPRPMSDLFTPTPTATPVPGAAPSSSTLNLVLAGLAVLVVIAILAVLIRFRDRP
jgi:hypothetical protein